MLVAFHPTKNAGEGELIPYGGGSTYNEIDGNLTLWKEAQIKLYHNRLRGPEFEPRFFRIEKLSCPDIVDKQGRQILLPVMRPSTEAAAETLEKSNADARRGLLAAMIADPAGTQADWGVAIKQSKGRVNGHLQRLEKERFVVERLNKWSITKKGIEAVS